MSPKGILAADESSPTCNKRFEKLGIEQTEEKRREYRELLITAPGLEQYISGFILFDETIRQSSLDGKTFVSLLQSKGMDAGIKVDKGLVDFPPVMGEKVTTGLEGLPDRLKEYHDMGATFAKWRAVYTVGKDTPSENCMQENAKVLAQYALFCQEADIVPMVEPEVLFDGEHTIEECYEATSKNLKVLFTELKNQNVYLPGLILKTSMVIEGKDAQLKSSSEKIAELTIKCLKENVPSDIGGIVFLSGGQESMQATVNLNAMHKGEPLPWPLSFSYSRALQNEVLKYWASNQADTAGAQKLLVEAAKANSLASEGKFQ
jgi:fructose-bisphosphate aldolase class I